MNQVIRIIFDDNISYEQAKINMDLLETAFGHIAAVEFYEEEFTDEDNEDGKEQRQEKPE